MHRNEETNRTTGLSTDDLAEPTGSGAQTSAASAGAPAFPGEGVEPTQTERVGSESAGPTGTEAQGEADTPDVSGASSDEVRQLLTGDEERGFRDRWQDIQNRFVDDPREAVHQADALVADVMQTLASTFAQHKKDLEAQWGQGQQIDTEELRGALRRYRSFFNRLLST
ncbi:hypothetical protein [Streptomyces sp. NPDC058299]|uniref:hypothetical protein n=1 Tax=unclassified Streptomyces TaxID=2593676 RepID=UPI0036E4A55A